MSCFSLFARAGFTYQNLKNPTIQSYIEAVRWKVRMTCRRQDTEKPCLLRDTLDCGMNRYLPLVMEAVDEVFAFLERVWSLRERRGTNVLNGFFKGIE
jgi:hypothetical protein